MIGKCPCRVDLAEQARDAALTAAAEAHPEAYATALRVIRGQAQRYPSLSPDTVRPLMRAARVEPRTVVVAAFRQAAANGWVRPVGTGWQSLIFEEANG